MQRFKFLKVFFATIFISGLFLFFSAIVKAQDQKVLIEVFSREDCIHCIDQKSFLDELATQRDDFIVSYLDLKNEDNKKLWHELSNLENLPQVTPITLIGDTIIQGFATKETTGQTLISLIDFYKQNPTQISGFKSYIEAGGSDKIQTEAGGVCEEECTLEDKRFLVSIPFYGTINPLKLSLPIMAGILGFIDGFNPCAMWVLVTFLLILAQLKSRKKMFTYAGLFIIAEAIMYSLILTVWYTAWDFVGLDKIVTPLVGFLALGGGAFFLYEFKTFKAGECKVTNLKQRQKLRSKIQDIITKPLTISTAIGIIFIAFSVNVIEFACSIGIPQTFTKILELNQLSLLQTSTLMGLYILMYMVDDFIVFGIALYSFEKIGLTSKYSKISNLLGGILLLILGLILIINPALLRVF